MAAETNNKKITVDQLKKALTRSKSETDNAIAAVDGGETATDKEVDEMLDEVFGTDKE